MKKKPTDKQVREYMDEYSESDYFKAYKAVLTAKPKVKAKKDDSIL